MKAESTSVTVLERLCSEKRFWYSFGTTLKQSMRLPDGFRTLSRVSARLSTSIEVQGVNEELGLRTCTGSRQRQEVDKSQDRSQAEYRQIGMLFTRLSSDRLPSLAARIQADGPIHRAVCTVTFHCLPFCLPLLAAS